jgi:hypothetical protein
LKLFVISSLSDKPCRVLGRKLPNASERSPAMVCGKVRVVRAANDNRCWATGSIASRRGVKLS